jgi:hypothetical protein
MGAEHQYHGVDSDKSIGQVGQGKSSVCKEQDREGDHERECFQDPGETGIVWVDCGPNKDSQYGYQQYQGILS